VKKRADGIDSLRALTESMYASHGPQGVMDTINANPQLRSPMLGHVRGLAGAASPRPQHGMFSGVMHTQSNPLRAAAAGAIAPKIAHLKLASRVEVKEILARLGRS
jgi:hypothetical protein